MGYRSTMDTGGDCLKEPAFRCGAKETGRGFSGLDLSIDRCTELTWTGGVGETARDTAAIVYN